MGKLLSYLLLLAIVSACVFSLDEAFLNIPHYKKVTACIMYVDFVSD